MIDFTKQDGIDYTGRDVEQLIADARAGRLGTNGRRALMVARAQRIERAAEIINLAAGECRALVADETRSVDGLIADARAMEPVISALLEVERCELALPAMAYSGGEPQYHG